MKLKTILWATAAWTVVVIVASAVMVWYVIQHPPGPEMDRFAAMSGQAVATITVMGYAALWLPFCYKVGKRRREERDRQDANKKRRPLND